ncbi:MAG: CsgG/HfaB family protein [Gemmatimonadaceae bacterium]
MNRSLRMLVALAPLVAFAPVAAQSAPVVAVLVFENGSFGKDAKDYADIGKGIADIMITDLASSPKVRVVDRERVQNILAEQNLTKSGAVDGATAVRVGKMMGACYSIYGTFMRGPNGDNMLTVHTTSNETGQIQNAQKVQSKSDDIMALIAEASAKFANAVDVKACAGTVGAARSGDAPAAVQQSAKPAPAAGPALTEYANRLTPAEKQKLESVKLDARTMLIYSRALDAKDRKENAKALALFQQVSAKYPAFDPAAKNIQALKSGN